MALSEKNIIVKQLREKSQGSLKVCNDIITKILEENKSGLTIPEIIEKGMAEMASHKLIIAAKRDNNGSNFFSINTFISPFDYKGIIIKFGCESEQGLKSLKTTYKDILDKITELCLANDIEYISDALGLPFDDSKSIYTTLKEISGSLNENISITDLEIAESISNIPNTYMEEYIHSDSSSDKSGGLIIYNCKDETMKESVRKILHQLVYTNPLCLKKNELVKSIIEETTIDVRENIIKENELVDQLTSKVEKLTLIDKLGEDLKTELKEAKATLKSIKKVKEDFIEKAVESKLNKFISEVSFEEQEYMFYKEEELPKQTIKKYLESKGITIFDYVVV